MVRTHLIWKTDEEPEKPDHTHFQERISSSNTIEITLYGSESVTIVEPQPLGVTLRTNFGDLLAVKRVKRRIITEDKERTKGAGTGAVEAADHRSEPLKIDDLYCSGGWTPREKLEFFPTKQFTLRLIHLFFII
ncbi:unnamed protein product [Arabis nemorensis]|uniref:Uncharacterized protein n=1 Tax=Arabis nemorensis TaxID=586526 RepID=A0A565CRF2_9BRAS|nr:unnamed protein product [Arabis nemorensis]